MYWNASDNLLIEEFYYCITGSTSGTTRNRIFRELTPKFNFLIGNAIQLRGSGWSILDKEEAKQDCLLQIWNVLSSKLDETKLQGTLNFLWICVNNLLITLGRRQNLVNQPVIIYNSERYTDGHEGTVNYHNNMSNIAHEETIEDDIIDDIDISDMEESEIDKDEQARINIIIQLDKMIKEQEKLNRTNAIYLSLLRAYLILNDFNGKGFQKYICETLNISRKNFYQINYKLGIRSQVFNDKNK